MNKRLIPLAASLALTTVIVTITALTNADTLIDDIQRAVPWTRGGCNIWSGLFLGVMSGASLVTLALAWVATRAPSAATPIRRVAQVLSVVLVVYWVGLSALGARTACIA